MKLLQINTVAGLGSTGRTTKELSDELIKLGHKSYIAYGQGRSDYINSVKIGTTFENHFHNLASRIFGNQGYYTFSGTNKLVSYILQINPDLIHLRNLHGNYLNLEILFQYLAFSKIPVVWTLHDCWAFTGKCAHYTEVKCYKWENQCYDCPQIKKYPPSILFDRSAKMFNDKKKWFTSLNNMRIITVSNWLANEVRRSFLNKYDVVPIYNWVDQNVFKPNLGDVKAKYGIKAAKFVILFVSAGWNKVNSKYKDFIDLISLLSNDMQPVIVGKLKRNLEIPEGVMHLPYISDKNELSSIYSMADVYVHLSMEDTFGKVIAESLSCGTPAIVYNSTAPPELIAAGCGYVVEKGNINEIFNAVKQIKELGKEKYSEACIKHVTAEFNMSKNISKTLNIYNELMSSHAC